MKSRHAVPLVAAVAAVAIFAVDASAQVTSPYTSVDSRVCLLTGAATSGPLPFGCFDAEALNVTSTALITGAGGDAILVVPDNGSASLSSTASASFRDALTEASLDVTVSTLRADERRRR